MRLSEALIASEPALEPFRSVTGFQCVQLAEQDGGGFVTFEGNGRREALRRAFADSPQVDIQVEVRLFLFPNKEVESTISRRVHRTREWKGVVD